MVIAIVILAILLIGACTVIAMYRSELLRWAAFLKQHPQGSNTRLATALPIPGSKEAVRAIDEKLDEASMRERRIREDEEDLLQGLAGLSHDIRTPLAGAKGYVQLAISEDDSQEIRRCLALTEERIDSIQVLLDQLFDYMRVPSMVDVEELEEQDIIPILASVLAGNYPVFEEKGWRCDIELENSSMIARIDRNAMKRVFENIISNILKYGRGDLSIFVQDDSIVFSNSIAPDAEMEVEQIFNRFYRGDLARDIPGAGLGLTIVKQLCDDMGMYATAEICDGRFVFTINK